jgi:hypothetical protein
MQQFTICVKIVSIEKNTAITLIEHGNEWSYDISLTVADFMNSKQAQGIKGCKKKGVYYSDNPFEMFLTDDIEDVFYRDMKRALRVANQFTPHFTDHKTIPYEEYENIRNRYKVELNYRGRFIGTDDNFWDGEEDEPQEQFAIKGFHNHNHQVTYTCHNLTDVVAAIFHYYMVAEYKFNTCHHCGKVFATQTLKRIYCNRISPYKNKLSQKKEVTKRKSCYQMVHDVKQYINQPKYGLRKVLANRITHSKHYKNPASKKHSKALDIYETFASTCDKYNKVIDEAPTPENFDMYIRFLKEIEEKREWYIK